MICIQHMVHYNIHSPYLNKMKLPFLGWLLHIWIYRNWYYKIYYNHLEKVTIILWAIWKHRTNFIFHNHKYNPSDIIEQATHHLTILYNKNNNIVALSNIAEKNQRCKSKKDKY